VPKKLLLFGERSRAAANASSCFRNGIGRTTAYKEIKEGRLHPKKVGKRTLISVEEEARWFDSAPAIGAVRHD
jgi:hypothetical protein